jgi:hypothetical protein
MSETKKGKKRKPFTEETKRKMSESIKKSYKMKKVIHNEAI